MYRLSSTRLLQVGGLLSLALALGAFYFSTGKTVSITDAGQSISITTRAGTVAGALNDAGIQVYPEDLVLPRLDDPLSDGESITIQRSFEVEVEDGGNTLARRARGHTLAEILASLSVALAPGDAVVADGQRAEADSFAEALDSSPRRIVVLRAVPFTVIDDGQSASYSTTAETVEEALANVGVRLDLGDRLTPARVARLAPDMTITIVRAKSLIIQVDGYAVKTRVTPGVATVGQALASVGITLDGDDYSLPGTTDPLPAGGIIAVKRVTEQVIAETASIEFETTYLARSDLELDSTLLVQEGLDGVLERRIRIRYEDGVEVSRAIDSEEVRQAPANRIIGYGTNIVIRTLDSPDGPIQYWRKIYARVASYSPARSGTSPSAPWYGRTRTGKKLTKGLAAVDPTVIPLGSKFYVIGYGFGSAEDTGGGVQGKFIDLGYDDDNYVSWHGYVDVYLLAPPPPPDQIVWVLP